VVMGEVGATLCQSLLMIREYDQGQADVLRTSVQGGTPADCNRQPVFDSEMYLS
jgi:hypothetical protein